MRSGIALKSVDHPMPQASPGWQTAFLVWSIVCIGCLIFSGWRAGIIRGLIFLGAIAFSCMIGSAVAIAVPAGLIEWLPLPILIAKAMAGVAVGFVVFAGIWLLGAALFKRTAQQHSLLIKLLWGGGGAVCGLVVGLIVVLSILAGIRAIGAISEARVEARGDSSNAPSLAFWESSIVKLKRSIEAGETGAWIQQVDVTPASFSRIVKKIGRVVADRHAAQRFLESPHVTRVVSDRAFVNLVADPEINEAAINGQYGAILMNPKVFDAIRDPVLWEKMQAVSWEAALDEALIKPTPDESPE